MGNFYLWCKALHIISLISWMAAMLYLPRIFVYHAESTIGSESYKIFKTMERRLLKIIMTPAMIFTFLFGVLLIMHDSSYYLKSGWLHFKLLLVIFMAGLHGYFAKTVRSFANNNNQHSAKFYRIINEAPTILMVLIVILAIIKPF